jgi:hypothetical protein
MTEKKSKLAENKTKPTQESVLDFLNGISPEQKRKDSLVLYEIMKEAIGEEPILWSNSFVGFGMVRHKSAATGREADWMRIGFAPRKTNLSIYFGNYIDNHTEALEKLGKHKTGMGCLYVNKLSDINLGVLKEMIDAGLGK